MRPGDQFESVGMVKLLWDVLAEGVASPAGGNTPTASVIGVGPEQVAHGTLVWDLLHSVQLSDVVQGIDWRGQSSMEAEDLG